MAQITLGRPIETIAATTTTVSTALAANCNRIGGLLVNKDATDGIRISFTDATAATNFFVLEAGSSISLAGIQSIVYAKAVANTPSLYCLELVG